MFRPDDPLWKYLRGNEIQAFTDIQAWANRPPNLVEKALKLAGKPIEVAYEKLPPWLTQSVSNTIAGTLAMLRDGAGCTVSQALVLRKLKAYKIQRLEGIWDLDIGDLDRHANGIIQSHAIGCAGIGGGSGAAGVAGMVADLPGLYTLLFRMVLELGFLYGFDSHSPVERHLALQTLVSGHDMGKLAKEGLLTEASRVQRLIAKGATWKELEQSVLVVAIQQIAEKLGVRIVKRKLAQALIVVGAVVGATSNYALARDVGYSAYQAYRLRFLHRRVTMRRDRGW